MRGKRQVTVVTTARRSATDDIVARQRRYLYAMAIRTLSVILAFFVFHGPLRWICLVLGMFLPWVSVNSANAGPLPPDEARPELVQAEERPALPPGGPTIDME